MPMSDKKMTGKQEVVGGFDLDAFVGGAMGAEEPNSPAPKRTPSRNQSPAPKKPAKPVPDKPEKPRLTQRVQIRMTDAEFQKIEDACGMVPASTFLRKFLQDNGLI